ncbi:MAG: serine/threonine-protein kinase [Planctomycetaceae bacterium]
MAERQLGPFLINEKLGGGGMGVVYRAQYTKTGQIVALKLLPDELSSNPRLVARFERELEILKKLKHPNIVPCYGGGKLGNQRFFAMELVTGGSLSGTLKKRGKLPWEEVIRLGIQVCAALEHAHEQGIIHRDLKPANLLIGKDGKLKLADFGIARDLDATGLTATGRTVGTFAYMAPEQVRGEPPVTPKTDLYALGCVLFELLTGRPPFDAPSAPELMFQHIQNKPPRVASIALDCPVWLDALVAQLLEKDPEKRPRDALAVSQALREVEEKVAQQASVSTLAVNRSPTMINVTAETEQARKLLQPKKRKKKQTGPFWTRTWFMSVCLAGLLGLIAIPFIPASEETLFEQARVLMESQESADWRRAYENELAKLQTKFPNGKHHEQVQAWVDKFEMHRAEEQLKYRTRFGQEPKTEAERLYSLARRYQNFGDVVAAEEKYKSLIELLKDDREARPYVNLARQRLHEIESEETPLDRRQVVENNLERAENLYKDGKTLEARRIWNSIVNLYEGNRELRPQVRHARLRLADKDPDEARTEEGDDERK